MLLLNNNYEGFKKYCEILKDQLKFDNRQVDGKINNYILANL